MSRALALFGLAAALAGCPDFPTDGRTYACEEDADCGADELCIGEVCTSSFVDCGDGTLIDEGQVCDGAVDCPNGADESALTCGTSGCTDQVCADLVTCISTSDVCDGFFDCPGGEDESFEVCG